MKIFILSLFLIFSACSLKNEEQKIANLKTQTLIFSQKQKITQNNTNAVVTMSFLNPVLDEESNDDIFAFLLTPNIEIQNLEIFINNKKAKIENLDEKFYKYILQNKYTNYLKISSKANKEESKLRVKICLNSLPCFELNYQKYPKSLYYRSVDVDTQYN